jgi:hypothetical protein
LPRRNDPRTQTLQINDHLVWEWSAGSVTPGSCTFAAAGWRTEPRHVGVVFADPAAVLATVAPLHYRSSRRPLKKGCRTLPSSDLARYSISAFSCGSTQMPLCAMRLVYGCVLRTSGVNRLRKSVADFLSKP